MITFSYQNFVAILKAFPLCPKPKALGVKHIPFNEPVLYVYNHVTRRAEPLFLGLAAPSSPPIRFLAEITLLGDYLLERTRKDIINSVFSTTFQMRNKRNIIIHFLFEKMVNILTKYFIAQMKKFKVIPVYLHEPSAKEERLVKRRINRQALVDCLASLEAHIPLAIAPSGGSTYEEAENAAIGTIVPTLASFLYRRGKIVKIIPCVIQEKPPVTKKTYGHYLADRIFLFCLLKKILSRLEEREYQRPRVTVQFLPPLTFPYPYPSKAEKIAFVHKLQKMMFEALNSHSTSTEQITAY